MTSGSRDSDRQERRAPVLRSPHDPYGTPRRTIAWSEHVEAWNDYARRFGAPQSAERVAERGGFSIWELRDHLGREPETLREVTR